MGRDYYWALLREIPHLLLAQIDPEKPLRHRAPSSTPNTRSLQPIMCVLPAGGT